MESIKLFDRRAKAVVAVIALLLSTFIPGLASAAQVTERSIELSSSSAQATGVTYKVNFTPTQSAGAAVIDFCQNSPTLGDTCTAPAGFDAHSATTSGGFTIGTLTNPANNTVMVTGSLTATPSSVTLVGITNPNTAGPLYARVVTYTNDTDAAAYTSAAPGAHLDDGGIAISITNTVGVSGAVMESMIFCVSGAGGTPEAPTDPITANCGGTLLAPTLKLGKDNGNGVIALDSADVYTGTIYTQLSTNASSGAIISLKSSAAGCGGLINSSEPTGCYIKPALTGGVTAGNALFGVKTGATVTGASGTLQPVGNYNNTTYALNYTAGDTAGVTSTYGDPILNTNNLPANNLDMPLTFGASVTNNTPAGNYSADLSLVATGKF